MQKWEYTMLQRTRVWTKEKGKAFGIGTDWNNYLDDKLVEKSIYKILAELGTVGWELVSISPRSGYLGGYEDSTFSSDYAGFTDTEIWVFKRPKNS